MRTILCTGRPSIDLETFWLNVVTSLAENSIGLLQVEEENNESEGVMLAEQQTSSSQDQLQSLLNADGQLDVDQLTESQICNLLRCFDASDIQQKDDVDEFCSLVRNTKTDDMSSLMAEMKKRIGLDFWNTTYRYLRDSVLVDKSWIRATYEKRTDTARDVESGSPDDGGVDFVSDITTPTEDALERIRAAVADFTESAQQYAEEVEQSSADVVQRQLSDWINMSETEVWPYMVQIVPMKKFELESLWEAVSASPSVSSALYEILQAKYDLTDFFKVNSDHYVPIKDTYMERRFRVALMDTEWVDKCRNATASFMDKVSTTLPSMDLQELFESCVIGIAPEDRVIIGEILLSFNNGV